MTHTTYLISCSLCDDIVLNNDDNIASVLYMCEHYVHDACVKLIYLTFLSNEK